MEDISGDHFVIQPEVLDALEKSKPVVALETAVITHGLPYPQNIQTAKALELEVRGQGAVPATIAVLNGKICVGLSQTQLEWLASFEAARKISIRDYAAAVTCGWSGGTTVSGTLFAANHTGIRVFATGGIGGVHRGSSFDISADLPSLARIPIMVVCAGAKAILDLDATLEYLETHSIPVIGYQSSEFPAFYSASSGLPTPYRADTPEMAAEMAHVHWELGFNSAVLLTVPPPESSALPYDEMETTIHQAVSEANILKIRGQALTPFLLQSMNRFSGGKTLQANFDLLVNNARIAGQVAQFLR